MAESILDALHFHANRLANELRPKQVDARDSAKESATLNEALAHVIEAAEHLEAIAKATFEGKNAND